MLSKEQLLLVDKVREELTERMGLDESGKSGPRGNNDFSDGMTGMDIMHDYKGKGSSNNSNSNSNSSGTKSYNVTF